jgi:ABC-type branched-subunit amino acid transport system permease subunit
MEAATMSMNVGTTDRLLRIVVGIALLSLVFVGPQTLWGLIGIIPLATAVFRYCPAYALFGIRTCKLGSERQA